MNTQEQGDVPEQTNEPTDLTQAAEEPQQQPPVRVVPVAGTSRENRPPIVLRISGGKPVPGGKTISAPRVPEDTPEEETSEGDTSEGEEDEARNTRGEQHKVEKLLNMGKQGTGYVYEVLWADGTKSWQTEEDCRGCIGLVNTLRHLKGLPKSKLKKLYGATGRREHNLNNWREIEDAINGVDQYDRIKDKLPPVSEFSGRTGEHSIQMLGLQNHIYVIYFTPDAAYVADGSNYIIEEEDAKKEVEELLGEPAIGVRFLGQGGIDFCASSAVLIALEFRKLFRSGRQPTILKADRTLTDRIVAQFHPEKSLPHEKPKGLRNVVPDICPVCGKQFLYMNRRAYSRHVLNHKKTL